MSIYKSAVTKPITTIMVFTAVVVLGVYSLRNIPIDLYPEMEPPFISVMTTYAGANAADIETNVTKPIEDAMNSVDNLKEVTSISYDNLSLVNLEFEWGTNLDEVMNDVRSVIDATYNYLPDGCERPSVFKFNTSMMPILFYAITAEDSYPGLEKLIEEKLVNPLNRIEGVGSVSTFGEPKRIIYVDVDPKKLDAYALTLEQIGSMIASENLNMPSGNVKMGQLDYQLRVEGEFSESDQLNGIVVGNVAGKPIYLRDVAMVKDTLKYGYIDESINGKKGMRLLVQKQSGANTVKIAREVNQQLKELIPTLPPDIHIAPIMDTSDFIRGSIDNLSETLMWAFLFVILVVLFFLGRWRATLIIILTIPISLVVSFIYLYFTGSSLNVISLSSLSIAIGMVVDDAIVVLENITRHIERGSSPREAAIYATNEVWLAVIVTTMVIVAVFLPLTLVGGMTGVMFNELGWIVTITIVTSTLVAITLTPMLSSRLLKTWGSKERLLNTTYNRTIRVFLDRLDAFYQKTVHWVLHHKRFTVTVSIAIFVGSLVLGAFFVKTDFFPESDESSMTVSLEMQTGLRMEESLKTAQKVEQIIRERYPEITLVSNSTGADDEGSFFSLFMATGSNRSNLMMRLVPIGERDRSVFEIADDLRQQLDQIAEIVTYQVSTSSSMFGGTTNTVDIEIFGYDFNETNRLADEIRDRVRTIKGASEVTLSREKDRPELQVVLDREKLALNGLNSAMVSTFIRNRVDGLTASVFREEGDEYDIDLRFEEDYRNSITDLQEITIINPSGHKIKLSELGQVKEYWSPPNIEHKRRERIARVSVKPVGVSLGELANRIREEMKGVEVPPEIMINVGGAYEDQMEGFQDIGLLMVVSLILVFIVMASQFESFAMPFVIMFSIPFAFTGVVLILFLTGTTLSLIAALGAVLLIGIVVKNGIVLVDFINLMRDRGYELYEAIERAGRSRLRPVLMTAGTTILGMLPLALSKGEGSEIWSPMGITVIGGLVFSTIVTMVIVPVMYAILARRGERDKKTKLRKRFIFLDQ
ncbi:MAG TPA: efflux RND transporter permease subunit [Bacteroidales bacterium]|nr:efflux RND transporter permease subunit [Bacteroidales bacterium]HRZ20297.1 efflux RND transporter permease subunit [Bacteroidales bacterium]